MRRFALGVLMFGAAIAAALVLGSSRTEAAARIRPVPSLQPVATEQLWRRLVAHAPARTFAAAGDCRPLRAVFYAPTDWLRLATRLAAKASPCAQYYISIPPLSAAKTKFRSDQAWRIRALGPNFHALAEVHVPGWRAWIAANHSSWYQAGIEARRRMAAAGFDVSLGDDWIVNEFSSAVRRGLGNERGDMLDFVHGLYDGAGGPRVKGGVFDIGVGQGLRDPSTYKSQLEGWFQDDAFWSELGRYVSDWSQELYGDPRNYGVGGAALATRADYLEEYLRHQLVHARLGGTATAAARSFLEAVDSPLGNAAWQWGSGFGWTMVSAAEMADYLSAQVYALRRFGAQDGQPGDHWGFAWAPRNATAMPAAEFGSQTGTIIDRLAAAIRDSGHAIDTADPGAGACAPPGESAWCGAEIPGAWFNDAWKTFGYWGQIGLAFGTAPQRLTAGSVSAPIVLRTRLAGAAFGTPSAIAVSLASSSAQGRFSVSPDGPWTSILAVTIPAGGDASPSVYYEDTAAGRPVLTATALGTAGGTQTQTVVAGPAVSLTVSPRSAALVARRSRAFVARGADVFGNRASLASAVWSVAPRSLGRLSRRAGGSTVFRAGPRARRGRITVRLGTLSARAAVVVRQPAVRCVVPKLRGKTLSEARRELRSRHCTLGRVRRAYSWRLRAGRVVSQRPAPGTRRARGSVVSVTVSRGRAR